MKRTLISLAPACAVLIATAASALSFQAVVSLSPEPVPGPALERSKLDGRSVYQLTSRWVNQQGRSVELIELAGRFAILAMIFTSCPSECPTMVRDLQALERSLSPALLAETRFVLVSIDPARDKPAVLRQYAERMGLDRKRWTLLHGRAEDVRELSAVLGAAYGTTGPAGGLSHAKFVTLLGRQGEIEQQANVGQDPGRLVRALERAAAEPRP